MGSDPAPFFANLFLHFNERKWMNELKKNDLLKARKLCNTFRFIDDLNSINDGREFENNFSKIYPEELQLSNENTDKHEASYLDLDIKIKDEMFHSGLFDKRDSFLFSIVRMTDNSSIIPSSIVCSAISAESLRIARANNNLESFTTAIKPLIARMSRLGVSIEKMNSCILKFFNKHQVDFNNIFQSKKELLDLVSQIMNVYFFIRSGQSIKSVAIAVQIRQKYLFSVNIYIKNKIKNKNNK